MAKKILIVDDDHEFCQLLTRILRRQYELEIAHNGEQALTLAPKFKPHVVLLDVAMPGIDGYETCLRLKQSPEGAETQVVMVSAKSFEEEQLRAFNAGADDYLVKPIDPCELDARVRLHIRLLEALHTAADVRAEITHHRLHLNELTEQRAREIAETKDIAVLALADVAESRDQDTGDHLLRMRAYAQLIAEELREHSPYADVIDDQFLEDLYRSSPLHDIGKVGISDAILLKPARLTPQEFEIVKQHTTIGANILDNAVFHSPHGSFLAMAALIARFHHERFDGNGYPAGLIGREIPLPARIVAVADVFDAISSERPYKPAYPPEVARTMIEAESGSHFDPVIVEAFLRRFDEMVELRQLYEEQIPVRRGAVAFREHETEECLV